MPRKKGKKIGRPNRYGAKHLENKLKAVEVLNLRLAGYSYQRIAEKIGYASASGAWAAVKSALHELIAEPAEDVLKMELARLDRYLLLLHKKIFEEQDTSKIDVALRVAKRRAELLGLDRPIKVDARTVSYSIDLQKLPDDDLRVLETILAKLEEQSRKETTALDSGDEDTPEG